MVSVGVADSNEAVGSEQRPAARVRSVSAATRPRRATRGAAVRPVNPTRARVLAAALTLFNDRGTARVTTNHIAAEAGLSPGNLYYWFRNKQQVIRALVEQWLHDVEAQVAEVHEQPAHVHALWDDLSRNADLERRYRFVRRELLALMHDDPELALACRNTYQRRLASQVAYVCRLVQVGVLRAPEPPRTPEDIAVALWLVAEYWSVHHELITDDAVRRRRESGIRPTLAVLSPYLTEQGVLALETL